MPRRKKQKKKNDILSFDIDDIPPFDVPPLLPLFHEKRKRGEKQKKNDVLLLDIPLSSPLFDVENERKRRQKASKSRRSIPKSDIRKLWEKQKGKCAICGKRLHPFAFHVDHKKPIALGGSNSIRNLQLLCPECHTLKTLEDRKKISRKRRKTREKRQGESWGFYI